MLNNEIVLQRVDEPKKWAPQIADLYAKVFAGKPWDEYTRCNGCTPSRFYGLGSRPGNNCGGCSTPIELAYPQAETENFILRETKRPGSVLWLAVKPEASEAEKLAGFCWGFTYPSVLDFAADKYATDEMRGALGQLFRKKGLREEFFYISDCGVDSQQRGKGIADMMVSRLVWGSYDRRLPVVMRTRWDSPMMAIAEKNRMAQIMGPAVKIDRVARTIEQTGEVVDGVLDTERPDRVLVLSPKPTGPRTSQYGPLR